MPKFNIEKTNPVHFSLMKSEQAVLKRQLDFKENVEVRCPFCNKLMFKIYVDSDKRKRELFESKCHYCGQMVITGF